MMTEDEAKQKWCPHARVGVRGSITDKLDRDWKGTSHNRAILLDNDEDQRIASDDVANCIGSACMAWRDVERVIPSADQPASEWVQEKTGRGYCGLAGEPK